MKSFTRIQSLFQNDDLRSKKANKNIVFSIFLKGGSILISFLLVSTTINYLNVKEFGIWLTLSSLLVWINYFDIGLGNGLRNKLTEAFSINNLKLGQIYVSTTFALLSIIMFFFFVVFLCVFPFLDFSSILNVDDEIANKLSKIIIIIFGLFCFQFVIKTVGIVLVADQKPALNDLINVLANLLALVIIYVLTLTTKGSLNFVAFTFSSAPVIVMMIAYVLVFNGKYKQLKPKISLIQFKHTKDLVGLGIQFFIIQIAVSVVIYTSTNIIIAQLFGSEEVTIYNVANKYFYSISMAYIIVLMPFWSAATDAYSKKDFLWIKRSINKLIYVFFGTVLVFVLMILFADIFYEFWVGDSVKVPKSLSIIVAFYCILFNWSNTFIYFINGIGKIRLQLIITLIVAVLYIPLAVYLGKVLGVNGVILASCISIIPTSILMPIQCYKLYSNKASGIWIK